jgi:hypothetical protein
LATFSFGKLLRAGTQQKLQMGSKVAHLSVEALEFRAHPYTIKEKEDG